MLLPAHTAAILHAKAHRVLRSHVAEMLEPFGLTMQEWVVVQLIHDNTDIRITEISEILSVETPLVTKLLNSLKKKKLVTKKPASNDKREKVLELTALGTEHVLCSAKVLQEKLESYFHNISHRDMQGYLKVLASIANKADE